MSVTYKECIQYTVEYTYEHAVDTRLTLLIIYICTLKQIVDYAYKLT